LKENKLNLKFKNKFQPRFFSSFIINCLSVSINKFNDAIVSGIVSGGRL